MHPGCQPTRDEQPMRFVYPNEVARILAPRELDGQRQIPVMKAVHRRPDAMLFWYLDEAFLGTTQGRHILEVPMTPGTHTLTITDDEGHRLSRTIEVE
jgi:penicillin-binding protein 1C